MANIWIGDFRTEQIKNYCLSLQTENQDGTEVVNSNDDIFITDQNADYSWFENVSIDLLANKSKNAVYNVIINIGHIDCINSCIFDSIKIDKVAEKYLKLIKEISGVFTNCTFYLCSVTPMASDYPCTYVDGGVVGFSSINKAIGTFNDKISLVEGATYIDCFDYLFSTSFDAYDSIHYTLDTCKNLYVFITDKFTNSTYVFSNMSRLRVKAPDDAPNKNDQSFLYWTTDFNNCIEAAEGSGCVLPNCTGYAWGRFMEIMGGETPKLSTGDAGKWWKYTEDGYERGQEPRVGAVICWSKAGAEGHVAIVEKYDSTTGEITTSESAWSRTVPTPEYDPNNSSHFWTKQRTNSDGHWGASGSGYEFQGFIYNPGLTATLTSSVSKNDLCTKNSYDISTEEMKPNAQYIWQFLGARGWTLNAVAALLGNLQQESKMSPCVWESLVEGSTIKANGTHEINKPALQKYYNTIITDKYGNEKKRGRYPGYGLVQWTSYTKLYDWCYNLNGENNGTGKKLPYWDIDSQLLRIIYEADNGIQWALADYNYGYEYKGKKFKGFTFKNFITSTEDPGWLAAAFAFCYEKPGRSSGSADEKLNLCTERDGYATSWYQYLSGYAVTGLQNYNFSVKLLKIDKVEPTSAVVSFIVRNSQSSNVFSYTLEKNKKKVKSDTIAASDGIATFDLKDLQPNSNYKLSLVVTSEDTEVLSETLKFDTPQDTPSPAKKVEFTLTNKGNPKSVDSLFNLKVSKQNYFGYWWKNGGGYEIHLIVNGSSVKKIDEEISNISWSNFKIKDKFKYTCKTGDSIQIGVRTWVKDDNGTKVYDLTNRVIAAVSTPICVLNKPITLYLNTD